MLAHLKMGQNFHICLLLGPRGLTPPPSLLYGQPDRKISVFWQLLFVEQEKEPNCLSFAPEYWTSCGLISSFNSGFNQISQSGTILCKRNFTRSSWLESGFKDMFGFRLVYTFTDLRVTFCQFFKLSALKNCSSLPSMVQDGWVALSFLVCLFVCPAMVRPEQISTFFKHIKPVPLKSKQYQVIVTQYHQVPTSTAFCWPSAITYQPVPLHTDPVPPSINQYQPILFLLGDYRLLHSLPRVLL